MSFIMSVVNGIEGCLSSVEQNKVEKVKERNRRLGASGETETNSGTGKKEIKICL